MGCTIANSGCDGVLNIKGSLEGVASKRYYELMTSDSKNYDAENNYRPGLALIASKTVCLILPSSSFGGSKYSENYISSRQLTVFPDFTHSTLEF